MLRDQSPQHGGVVARKVLDVRGMAPGPAGEQPVLGEVIDEIRPGMVGIGRTVFDGTRVEEFKANILGVLENVIGTHPTVSVSKYRVSGHDATATETTPAAMPHAVIFRPPPMTSDSTSRLSAPSAMRVPISTRRWRTA